MAPGAYDIQAVDITVTEVFTNTTPTDAYRGAGRPEATHAIERIMDILAAEVGISREEVRRRNFITRVPVRHAHRPDLRLGRLPQDARPAARSCAAPRRSSRQRRQEAATRGKLLGRGALHLRGDLRPGAVGGDPRDRADARRLGDLDRAGAPDRQGHGDHRHLAARPGTRHLVVADRRVRAGHPLRRRRGDPRRHGLCAVRTGHLRQPQPGGGRHGGVSRGRPGAGEGQGGRGAHAGGLAR